MLLLFVGALDWVGLALGCIVIAAILASTKPIVGKGYLYPLCPFDKKALRALLIRKPISRAASICRSTVCLPVAGV